MKNRLLIFSLILAAAFTTANAQGRKALRINEVMVENYNSVVDEYGERVGWIELYNSNFSPLEISNVFLTTDSLQPRMYPVPLGDERTRMGKRQTVVFFADGNPTRGTFHTSFTLVPGKDNWIGLYDANGITLIDSITVPASLPQNASYASIDGQNGERYWEVRDGSSENLYITPGGPNLIRETNKKIENFAENDPHGFLMAVMAMCIVFSALLVLAVSFLCISKIGASVSRKNKAAVQGMAPKSDEAKLVEHDSGEEIAAIVMALHQHFNAHDAESTVLTINKVKRAYSPWSSKIYGLRHLPGN